MPQNDLPLPPCPAPPVPEPPSWADETIRFAPPAHPGYGHAGGYGPGYDSSHPHPSQYDEPGYGDGGPGHRSWGVRGVLIGGIAAAVVLLALGGVWIGLRTSAASLPAKQAAVSFPAAPPSAPSTAPPAAPSSSAPAASGDASVVPPSALTPAGARGVLAACRTILPAIMQLETQANNADSPAQVVAQITALQRTLSAAGAGAHDPAFTRHVQKLSDDFGRMAAAVREGGDPASFETVLQGDGTTVGTDCGLAGWRP